MNTPRNRLLALLVLAVVPFGQGAHAAVAATLSVTSNYLFRAISYSDDAPALQGGVGYSHDSGGYAGVWGSTARFPPADTELEYDLYAGYAARAGTLDYDLGAFAYRYSDSSAYNLEEYYLKAGFAAGSVGLYVADGYHYAEAGLSRDALDMTFSVHAGRTWWDGAADVVDYSLAAVRTFGALDIELLWAGSDAAGSEPKLALTVSRRFP